ncbi:MAG: hypothetical protein NVS3B14_05620 [Ktedonobacteraceae bacterium]
MFNLVGKRYLFLIISLIVIVPGAISLIFRGLNVGIDFAGGTSVEMRPRTSLTSAQITTLVKPLNLSSLQVLMGNDAAVSGSQNVWVRLDKRIDTTVQDAITSDLQAKYGSGLSVTFDDLALNPLSGTGSPTTVTVASVTKFPSGVTPKTSDIQALLAKLPATSNPSLGPATTSTTTATPAVTPTPAATHTPVIAVSPTVTATATAGNNPANIPVKVVGVYEGTTTQTFTLLTLTPVDATAILKLKSIFANSNANYVYVLDNAVVSGSVAAETTRNAFLAALHLVRFP